MVLATSILRLGNRIVAAIADANRRKAEREIARVLQRSGGRLTDRIEREIGSLRS